MMSLRKIRLGMIFSIRIRNKKERKGRKIKKNIQKIQTTTKHSTKQTLFLKSQKKKQLKKKGKTQTQSGFVNRSVKILKLESKKLIVQKIAKFDYFKVLSFVMKILLSILIYTVISTEIETIEDEVEVSEKEHIEIVDNASTHKELAQSKFFWTSESEEETPSIPWKPRVDKQNFDRQW